MSFINDLRKLSAQNGGVPDHLVSFLKKEIKEEALKGSFSAPILVKNDLCSAAQMWLDTEGFSIEKHDAEDPDYRLLIVYW